MQVALGDLADRLTIALRKRRIHAGSVEEAEVQDLLDSTFDIVEGLRPDKKHCFLKNLVQLCDLNNAIWHLEYEIRRAEEDELPDDIVGKRAKRIRTLNIKRVAIRGKMNEYSKTGYRIVNV